EAAFAELRVALGSRPSALPLIFNYAWQAFDGDGRAIARALAPPAELQAQLASLLISRHRIEDALAIWREAAITTPTEAQRIVNALIDAGAFGAAYEVWRASVASKL